MTTKVDWGWTLFSFCLGLLVCVLLAVACSPVRSSAEASQVNVSAHVEVLSVDEVGSGVTVYQFLAKRDGFLATHCILAVAGNSPAAGDNLAMQCQ